MLYLTEEEAKEFVDLQIRMGMITEEEREQAMIEARKPVGALFG